MIKRILMWLGLRKKGVNVGELHMIVSSAGEFCKACNRIPLWKSAPDTTARCVSIPQDIPQKTTYVECETCGVLVAKKKAKEVDRIQYNKADVTVHGMSRPEYLNTKTIVTDYFCTRCAKKQGNKSQEVK